MNKLVKIGFVTMAIVFSVISCSETTAQSSETTQEVVKNSLMTMSIEGMTCAMGCARAIENELKNVEGVSSAVVDFESATASVEFNSGLVSETGLIDFVNDYRDGSFKATTVAVKKSDTSKKSCCSSKAKACSSDKKVSADAEGKSCSDAKKSGKSCCSSKKVEKTCKSDCTKPCCVKEEAKKCKSDCTKSCCV